MCEKKYKTSFQEFYQQANFEKKQIENLQEKFKIKQSWVSTVALFSPPLKVKEVKERLPMVLAS